MATKLIANTIVDFDWGSGKYTSEKDTQDILITLFNDKLDEDGNFGKFTIEAINSADQEALYEDIIKRRIQFYKDIVAEHPDQSIFLQGWENRVINLVKFNEQFDN